MRANTQTIINGLGSQGVHVNLISPFNMEFTADGCKVIVKTHDREVYDVYWFDGHGDGAFSGDLTAQEVTEVSVRWGC